MVANPAALTNDSRPVALVIGNIHSGECCGKEALLMLLRDLALNDKHPWLDDVILLVAPNYNADGDNIQSHHIIEHVIANTPEPAYD